jgi:hypothetical protein
MREMSKFRKCLVPYNKLVDFFHCYYVMKIKNSIGSRSGKLLFSSSGVNEIFLKMLNCDL